MNIPIQLRVEDLHTFGGTIFDEDGCLAFAIDTHSYSTEIIFIKSILTALGHGVVDVYDCDMDAKDIIAVTDMPWSKYTELPDV